MTLKAKGFLELTAVELVKLLPNVVADLQFSWHNYCKVYSLVQDCCVNFNDQRLIGEYTSRSKTNCVYRAGASVSASPLCRAAAGQLSIIGYICAGHWSWRRIRVHVSTLLNLYDMKIKICQWYLKSNSINFAEASSWKFLSLKVTSDLLLCLEFQRAHILRP